MNGPYKCYACGKWTKGTRPCALTACLADDDGARVCVGPDCLKRIKAAGAKGYIPPLGGPRLFYNEDIRREGLKGK